MNRSFFFTHFKYWLKNNRSRFIRTPYISKVRKDYFTVDFVGCRGLVYLLGHRSFDFSIWSRFNTEVSFEIISKMSLENKKDILEHIKDLRSNFDWILDLDMLIIKDTLGYRCELCEYSEKNVNHKYFQSRSEFLIDHNYEPLLEWVNETLISENIIFYTKYCTKIVTPESFDRTFHKWDILYKYILK